MVACLFTHQSIRDREGTLPGQGKEHYRKLLLPLTSGDKRRAQAEAIMPAPAEAALTETLTSEILPAPGCWGREPWVVLEVSANPGKKGWRCIRKKTKPEVR